MDTTLDALSDIRFRQEMLEYETTLPKFPDGRLDYSNSPRAPVLSCFLEYKGKILLLRRSRKVGFYPNRWGVITGFLDRSDRTIIESAINELHEELGIPTGAIDHLFLGEAYELKDEDIENRTWVIYPILVKLETQPKILLDWENEKCIWINPADIDQYDTLPGLSKTLSKVTKFI
jgi:8-oxo-dGTP diphosphatase